MRNERVPAVFESGEAGNLARWSNSIRNWELRLKESRVFHHVGELVRSTLSDRASRQSSLSSRILGEAKAIGATVGFGLAEREAIIDGMILIDLRMEVGSKKTAPHAVSFATGWGGVCHTRFIAPIAVCHNVCDRCSLQITIYRNQVRVVLVQPFGDLRGHGGQQG